MRRTLTAFLVAAAAQGAQAADFRAVAENAAVLYDAPSRAATALFVVSRHYPLEVIVDLEAWAKVRDHTGALSWVEKKLLSDKRMVLVTAPSAEARERPDHAAPVAFTALQNVALELIEPAAGGWLRVRHPDGASGYIRTTLVWGA